MVSKRRKTFLNIFEEAPQPSDSLEAFGIIDQRQYPQSRRKRSNSAASPTNAWAQSPTDQRGSFSFRAKRSSFVGGPHAHDDIDELFDSDQDHLSTHLDEDSSSIDDVCLPMDAISETDELLPTTSHKAWPDVRVLNEISSGFRDPLNDYVGSPSLRHVNETEGIGRLRPPAGRRNTAVAESLRFAYFRDDLDTTAHSATLPGLLQPGQTYLDLFQRVPVASRSVSLPSRSITPERIPSVFWLDVLNPTEDEMKTISRAFGIHPLTTEDIILGETREKVELFHEYYFICFRSFDLVYEKMRNKAQNLAAEQQDNHQTLMEQVWSFFGESKTSGKNIQSHLTDAKFNELRPLNIYIVVFRGGVLTFHFAPTLHPANVRRRCRLLKDYLSVSSDWIAYALIDDITDGFAPMIEQAEKEVAEIEDLIIKMQSLDIDSDSEDELDEKSVMSVSLSSSASSGFTTFSMRLEVHWQKKNDMLRRIGEARKRVMSLSRLLGSKADVIKGFSTKCNETFASNLKSKSLEIVMYLGDIQDHIVTMVQSLAHCEKLLARSHSNYLAQINIDMTKVNNDMNDVLGKLTMLGTIVLPLNVCTGLWGMNVIVPGQDAPGLVWFFSITIGMGLFAMVMYIVARRIGVA